jgi:hypothetical protein
MSEMKTTPKAEPIDIPAVAPALRLVEEYADGVGVGEEDDIVGVVKFEEVAEDKEEDVAVSVSPTPVRGPAPLEFTVRATVLVILLYGPQPYPIEPLVYKYSTQ